MKKLMVLLMAMSLFMPFGKVMAEGEITDCAVNSSCFVYTPGDEVNFYRNNDERKLASPNSGITTLVLEDAGANSQYVKTLVLSPYSTTIPYFEKGSEIEPLVNVKRDHLSNLFVHGEPYWSSAKQDATGQIEMEYISLADLIKVFGATQKTDGTYTIDATKWGEKFALTAITDKSKKGFYTSTYDTTTNKVWAVEYTLDTTGEKMTAITVKQVDMSGASQYSYLPVVSFDKTYDCHSRQAVVDMACYSCDNDYKWIQVGSQAETCTLVPEVTSKGTCVKAVKTGVEDYIFEFTIIAFIAGISLIVIKRKDLFRAI